MHYYSQEAHKSILERSNPHWSQVPKTWDECGFLGNGMIGSTIYCAEHRSKRQVLRFVMGRTDVTAHRKDSYPARVPVGDFELEFDGWIYGGTNAILDLYTAQWTSKIVTIYGEAQVNAWVHSLNDVLVIEVKADENEHVRLNTVPFPQLSEAVKVDDGRLNIDQYFPKFRTDLASVEDISYTLQEYNDSEDGCIMASTKVTLSPNHHVFYATVENRHDKSAMEAAKERLLVAKNQPLADYKRSHLEWWQSFWEQSYVSIPDTKLEGFYQIQIYKLGSMARSHTPTADNQGPWTGCTPWPGTWFNMNVPLAYSPVYTSNHLDIGLSLTNALDKNIDNLINNVPKDYRHDSAGIGRSCGHEFISPVLDEVGNLTWVCHNYYRQYRYSMDRDMVNRLYPLLRRSIQFYIHLLKEKDGKYHLPPTISPEYGSFKKLTVANANYDLFLLQWGLKTLKELATTYDIQEDNLALWESISQRLVDYPTDKTGYLIGSDTPMTHGHRHYSHLLGIYPLHLLPMENPTCRELTKISLKHWQDLEGDMRGFSFAGSGCLYATLNDGHKAHACIQAGMELCKPNTFYREAGPVIESPLGLAEAVQYLLLQSHGGILRIFPAIPAYWQAASFYQLLAEGAFLVSACLEDSQLSHIVITSQSNEPLVLETLWNNSITAEYDNNEIINVEKVNSQYHIPINKGQTVFLYKNKPKSFALPAVSSQHSLKNYWGGHKPWRSFGIPFESED